MTRRRHLFYSVKSESLLALTALLWPSAGKMIERWRVPMQMGRILLRWRHGATIICTRYCIPQKQVSPLACRERYLFFLVFCNSVKMLETVFKKPEEWNSVESRFRQWLSDEWMHSITCTYSDMFESLRGATPRGAAPRPSESQEGPTPWRTGCSLRDRGRGWVFVWSLWLERRPPRVTGRWAPRRMKAGRKVRERCLKRDQLIRQRCVGVWAPGWAPVLLWPEAVCHPAAVRFPGYRPVQRSPGPTRTLRPTAPEAVSCCRPAWTESLSTGQTPALPGWDSHWIAGMEGWEPSLQATVSLLPPGPNPLFPCQLVESQPEDWAERSECPWGCTHLVFLDPHQEEFSD